MIYQEEINELQSILIKTEKILKDRKEKQIHYIFPSLLKLFEEAVNSGEFIHANRLGALQYYRMAVNHESHNSDWGKDIKSFVEKNFQKFYQEGLEKFGKNYHSQSEELWSKYITVYNEVAGKIGMRAINQCEFWPPLDWGGWIQPQNEFSLNLISITPQPLTLLNPVMFFHKVGCEYIKACENASLNYDIYSNYGIYHMRELTNSLKKELEGYDNAKS